MSAGSQWAGSKCRQGALLVMYVCITHTHTYSRRWTVGQLIHVHLMLLPLFICCFIAAAPGQFMCVCVWQSVVFGAAPGSRATCLLPLTEPLSSVSLFSLLLPSWPQPSVKVLRFMSKWFVRLPRHLISFLSLFRFSLFHRGARHIHSVKINRAAHKQDSVSTDWTPFNHL